MSFKYFRFYLSESEFDNEVKPSDVLEREWHSLIRSAGKKFGFIRASFDLISSDKSISILCQSEANIEIEKEKWNSFLQKNNIIIKEHIEYEVLQDEERFKLSCAHGDNCSHNHHKHHKHNHHKQHDHDKHHDHHWLKASIGLVCGMGLLTLSIANFNIPIIAYYLITGFSSLVTLYLGHKVYQSAWHSLMQKKMGDEYFICYKYPNHYWNFNRQSICSWTAYDA